MDARVKPAHDDLNEWLSPLHVMARQHLAHSSTSLVLIDLVLRLGLLLQIFLAVLDLGQAGAEDQILDLDLAIGLLVRALR